MELSDVQGYEEAVVNNNKMKNSMKKGDREIVSRGVGFGSGPQPVSGERVSVRKWVWGTETKGLVHR